MVITLRPSASPSGNEHERTAPPSIGTVGGAEGGMPEAYFGRVRPSCSRMIHSSGVSGSAFTVTPRPLMVKDVMTASRERETGIGERQGADTLTRRGEDRIANGRVNGDRAKLARSAELLTAVDEMNLDRRRLP